jgi:putative hydrolase of the HAD superfamily
VFDSHREGVEKPDPRYFAIALAQSGAKAEETIHVGDLYYVDVAGARGAGITPVLFDVADLYPEADCLRVRSLNDLVAALRTGVAQGFRNPT